jgi:subtilisin family serine protease
MAPGVNIKSAYPRGQYVQMSGTSFAAPFVTRAIALLWSIFTKATAAEISFLPRIHLSFLYIFQLNRKLDLLVNLFLANHRYTRDEATLQ